MSRFAPTPIDDELETGPLLLAERDEFAYAVRNDMAEAFAAGMDKHLRRAHYRRPEDGQSVAHYVTTLYFDSEEREIALACEHGSDNVKLRAREYLDRRGEVEVTEPLLWLEVKARLGAKTRKVRFSIPTREVPGFLNEGVITRQMIALQRSRWGESAEEVFREILDLCRKTEGPLRPDCLANYRRRAWEHSEGTMRITLDTELAYYRPPSNLFSEIRTLSEAVSGPPVRRAEHSIIEIKLLDEGPTWLHQLLRAAGVGPKDHQSPYSKFLAASRAVAGEA